MRDDEPPAGDQTPAASTGPDLTPEGIAKRKAERDAKAPVGCIVAIVAVIALVILGSIMGGDDGPSTASDDKPTADELEYGAFDVCTEFVKDRLKAPATASFRNYFQDDGEVLVTGGPTTFTVTSSVDSENSFGAKIRSRFICEVRHVSGTRWQLVDVQIT